MSSPDEVDRILDETALKLGEHFDSVQIFVTRHEPEIEGGTITATRGCGNWHARFGQITEWLIVKEEDARCEARKRNEM